MAWLKKSCCCYTLRNGTIIIGILFMISSAVALLMEIGLIVEWRDVKDNLKNERMITFVYPLLLTSLVLSSFYLVFSVLLLSGVKREKKVLLLPWLIWSAFYFFIGIGCAIFEISAGGGSLTSQIVNPIVYVLVHALWAYCILCIVAYYQSLKASDQKRKDQASNEHEYVDGLRPYYDEEACHRVQHKAIVHLDEVIHPRIHPHSMWSEPDDWEETRRQISWSKRTM